MPRFSVSLIICVLASPFPSSSEDLKTFPLWSMLNSVYCSLQSNSVSSVTECRLQNANCHAVDLKQIKILVLYHYLRTKPARPQRAVFNSDPRWIRSNPLSKYQSWLQTWQRGNSIEEQPSSSECWRALPDQSLHPQLSDCTAASTSASIKY